MNPSSISASIRTDSQTRLPLLAGAFTFAAGALFLLALYLGILTVANSWEHAWQQAEQDAFWVTLVALGFGTQLGLFGYQHALVRVAARGGALATGAGTGASTLGMLACCAHHLTDVAPLVGLAGFGGIASFLTEWKAPFIVAGLTVNAIGIGISLRNLRRFRA